MSSMERSLQKQSLNLIKLLDPTNNLENLQQTEAQLNDPAGR